MNDKNKLRDLSILAALCCLPTVASACTGEACGDVDFDFDGSCYVVGPAKSNFTPPANAAWCASVGTRAADLFAQQ